MTKEKQTLNQNTNRLFFTRAPSAERHFRQRSGLLAIPQGNVTQLTSCCQKNMHVTCMNTLQVVPSTIFTYGLLYYTPTKVISECYTFITPQV